MSDGGFSSDKITQYDQNNAKIKEAQYVIDHGRSRQKAVDDEQNWEIGSTHKVCHMKF